MKKTTVQSNINLETLAGGAFAEKLNEALMQVAENIQNPNTEATTKRQIQITLKFAPNKTRQLVSTQIAVTTKLAATEAIDTQMIMGVNMRTGQIEIAEYDGQIRGQMSFNDLQTQEQPAEPAQATAPAANETQPAAGAAEQQPAPTGKPLDLKNRNKKPAEVPTDQEQERQRRQQANSYRAETSILRRAKYLRTVARRSTNQQPQNSRKATSTKSLQWAKRP